MRIVGQRSTWRVQKASRHPEVNQESATRFKSNNQILSATLDRCDGLPFELGGHGPRLERSRQARIADLDAVESSTRQRRRETRSDSLDLGQLWHVSSVVR
jgi:hypothetical protein